MNIQNLNRNAFRSLVFLIAYSLYLNSTQACESSIGLKLENNKGGVFSGQVVKLIDKSSKKEYVSKTDAKGDVLFTVPCKTKFDLNISNYTKKVELLSPAEGGRSMQTLNYSPDMVQKTALFAMSDAEKASVDKMVAALKDTSAMTDVLPLMKTNPNYFTKEILSITDLDGKPLVGEKVYFVGEKRNKAIKGVTGPNGKVMLYLPKGDVYHLQFTYTKDYLSEEIEYSKGISEGEISISYMGTKEFLKRKKAEDDRIAAEEKRIKAEKAAFDAWCRKLKITAEEGYRRKLKETVSTPDTVVLSVLDRNKWKDKLIVCDLTGSMTPYANQLTVWYQLRYKLEKNLQFVFFNDGDATPDSKKVIGNTGGIYYTPSKGMDSLQKFISMVCSRGYGGDGPENNMEALIKGVKMAAPFKEIVMIADNYAPVKDIQLLKNFNMPVHIILCGSMNSDIHTDYLDIARKTGGSVHTMEEDIVNLASISEGQEVNISGRIYKVMGGKFVVLNKS